MLHITEKRKKIKPAFIPENEYAKILDSIVVACSDVILVHNNEILITKRNIYPRKDWWVIGGRMISGEDPLSSAKRKLKEETGLSISKNRFDYINVYSTNFKNRKQEPQSNGSHTISFVYKVEITPKEKDTIKLVNSEYSGSKWLPIKEVKTFFKKDLFKDMFLDIENKIK